MDDFLVIGNKKFSSRLLVGTGKYRTFEDAKQSLLASGTQIVTFAIRRLTQKNNKINFNLLNELKSYPYHFLPNTAGAKTAEEAIRLALLGREIIQYLGQEDNNFVKLEVINDSRYLLPDPIGTLKAAEYLVKNNFTVLPYINADPILAKHLEEIGCATIMPLGSPIGAGQGIQNENNLKIIIENSKVPVIIDAGIRTTGDIFKGLKLGADAILLNTAIAKSNNPEKMAYAMKMATQAGRIAYKIEKYGSNAGFMSPNQYAQASSSKTGLFF
uniref:Thiazole synthase n=1 Tax=Olisthodiscus luteus TaxID=83000 RepID=A0A7U0KSN5_OLILU|nr:Thiamine biosynthesis protein G [Olisthodiscus luteus]YP_010152825.1 Thiamine biosynthesis protein G [Olisthodiscus luteus]QQW50466.1 Thiamine biosynthesis protein G [Olisthodiscus luteus]QQW50486.1 Thiamine biosynthesis protein G [Olisthodiscus luteus]